MFGVLKEAISGSFLVMRKAAKGGHLRLDGSLIDGHVSPVLIRCSASARQRHDFVLDDEDADVMNVVIDKVRDVPRGIGQCVTFVAAAWLLKSSTALGRFIDRVLIPGDAK